MFFRHLFVYSSHSYSHFHIDSHPRDELHIRLRLNGHVGRHVLTVRLRKQAGHLRVPIW